jgi:hypothetical protein
LPVPRIKIQNLLIAPPTGRRADALALAALLVGIAVKSWERFHFGEWLRRPDVINQFMPWWTYLGDELRSGNIPGWNPYQIAGTPFVGDPQSGWMYLPSMISFLFFGTVTGIKIYVVLHLILGAFSMYAFARVLGLRALASLIAAIAFTFGPYLHHTTYCCNVQLHVEAWIPLALIGVEFVHRATTWSKMIIGWGLAGLGISQMLAGSMGQGAYDGVLVVGSYLAYRLVLTPIIPHLRLKERIRSIAISGAAVLFIGFGLGAAAVLPLLDVNADTNLAGGDYALVEDLESRTGATLDSAIRRIVVPTFDGRRTYVGIVTLALAFIAIAFAWRKPPVLYFLGMSVVVVIITLDTTLLHQVFHLLPRFRELHDHSPHRTLAVFMIGPATLAGIGADLLPGLSWRRALMAAVVPLLGISILALGMSEDGRRYIELSQPSMQMLLAVTALIAAFALGVRSFKDQRHVAMAQTALPVLLILGMLWEPSGRELVNQLQQSPVRDRTPTVVANNMNTDDPSGAGEFLRLRMSETTEPFRFLGYNAWNMRTRDYDGVIYQNRFWSPRYRRLLIGPRSMILRLNALQGYNPVQLTRAVDVFRTMNVIELDYHDAHVLPTGIDSPWLDVLRVQYILVPPEVPPGRPDLLHLNQRNNAVFDNDLVHVLRNPDALPHAWVVHEAQEATYDDALQLIESGEVDPRTVALLEPEDDPSSLAQPADPSAERVTVENYESDEMRLSVSLEADGIVVLSEIFDSGWKAEVDGEAVDILAVDGVLRGVPVSAGEHEIELEYRPRSITVGLLTTSFTALALLVGFFVLRRRPVRVTEPSALDSPATPSSTDRFSRMAARWRRSQATD